ncbi:MAG: hypothetical protein AAGJ46_08690 [Planctomycetota bacterium]
MRNAALICCLLVPAPLASAAVSIEAIVVQDQLLPGSDQLPGFMSNETVRSNGPRDVSVNAEGDFVLAVTTGPEPLPDSVWYFYGSVGGADPMALRRNTPIGGNEFRSFISQVGIGTGGELYYGAILQGTGTPASLWQDDTLLHKRGDAITTGPLQGQFFGDGVGSVRVRGANEVVWRQDYAATATGEDVGAALMSGIGAYNTLIKSGDPIGTLGSVADYSQAFTIFSNPEYSLSGTNILAATSLDIGESVMLLNGAPLTYGSGGPLVTNTLIPAADGGLTEDGVPIEQLRFSSYWGVNDAGDYAFAGNVELTTDGDTNVDGDILFSNGSILYREGDVVDGVTLDDGQFEDVKVLPDGRVAFIYADHLFVDDDLIVAPGDEVTLPDGSLSQVFTMGVGKLTVAAQMAAGGDGLPVLYFGGRLGNDDSAMFRLVPEAPTGDFNGDGVVDAADYTVWRDTLGSTTELAADANGNDIVDLADYDLWKANFQAAGFGAAIVPEPNSALLLVGLMLPAASCGRRSVAE